MNYKLTESVETYKQFPKFLANKSIPKPYNIYSSYCLPFFRQELSILISRTLDKEYPVTYMIHVDDLQQTDINQIDKHLINDLYHELRDLRYDLDVSYNLDEDGLLSKIVMKIDQHKN